MQNTKFEVGSVALCYWAWQKVLTRFQVIDQSAGLTISSSIILHKEDLHSAATGTSVLRSDTVVLKESLRDRLLPVKP